MKVTAYWLGHIRDWNPFGPPETEAQRTARIEDWHEHLWSTL